MTVKSYIIGSVIVFGVYLLIVVNAAKWAINISEQTEQNFADAVRTMQGK